MPPGPGGVNPRASSVPPAGNFSSNLGLEGSCISSQAEIGCEGTRRYAPRAGVHIRIWRTRYRASYRPYKAGPDCSVLRPRLADEESLRAWRPCGAPPANPGAATAGSGVGHRREGSGRERGQAANGRIQAPAAGPVEEALERDTGAAAEPDEGPVVSPRGLPVGMHPGGEPGEHGTGGAALREAPEPFGERLGERPAPGGGPWSGRRPWSLSPSGHSAEKLHHRPAS